MDEIARKLESELQAINEAMSRASEGSRRYARREAITAAIAPLQAELEQANEDKQGLQELILRRDAEIAQIRHAAFPDGVPKGYSPDLPEVEKQVGKSSADLQFRLATAEADTKWVAQEAQ